MGRTIEEIRAYIANTPAPRLSPQSRNAFTPSLGDLRAIAEQPSLYDAINLALVYGRCMGYRMGRREAQLARGGEPKAARR